jgi:hypothetical protein
MGSTVADGKTTAGDGKTTGGGGDGGLGGLCTRPLLTEGWGARGVGA